MPNIESRVDAVSGAKFISIIDIQTAFHQIPVAPEDGQKNCVCDGSREMGIQPLFAWHSVRFIRIRKTYGPKVLIPRPQSGLLAYVDDILLCTK